MCRVSTQATDRDEALRVTGLSVTYGTATPVLSDVNLVVHQGEFLAIAGPNGGGKTTLLRAVLGLVKPASGSVALYGVPADSFRDRARIGYLRQRSDVGVEAPVTVREVVTAGRLPRTRRFGPLRTPDRTAVDAAIHRVGLEGLESMRVRRLSGGQQQRVFLAKLLAAEPTLLFLDEPTTGVDADAQEQFAELLCELNSGLGVTILYVSHEFGAVERHVDRLVLVNGGIRFDGAPHDLPGQWHDPSHTHAAGHPPHKSTPPKDR